MVAHRIGARLPAHDRVVAHGDQPAATDGVVAGSAKRPFIRVTEIWVPTAARDELELSAGLYGPLAEFEEVSRGIRFRREEGLPGKAWAARHPIVLKDLVHSYFRRGPAAQTAGLTCAVALPIFRGETLSAVVVLFCGDDREHVGAIEVWHAPPGALEMQLVDGYYGTADLLEWNSRHIRFQQGIGLPGLVWETGVPVIMADLGASRQFLRWESAERVGIHRGVGIPCGSGDPGGAPWVLTLLSALGTPIAGRFETWVPDPRAGGLRFRAGYCEYGTDLVAAYGAIAVPMDAGILGRVWRSAVPEIETDLAAEPALIARSFDGTDLATAVVLPVIVGGDVKAIVAWYAEAECRR